MTTFTTAPQTDADSPDRPCISERVAERILARIASGELAPGTRLPGERQLAEEMGVSRVSVRAALQKLKTQGFLSAVQGGGTRVISSTGTIDPALGELVRVNLDNFHDLAEIRSILEQWAARRAALNRTAEHLAELEQILARMDRNCGAGTRKSDDDVAFHLAIAKASGSGIYLHIMSVIRGVLAEMLDYHRYRLFVAEAEDQAILAQHRTLFEAIRDGDGDRAAAAMGQHLDFVITRYKEERASRQH